jgi:hypothetical protein
MEVAMRILIACPLLLAAACSVQNDPRNGQTTIGFDQNVVSNTADQLGNAVEDSAAELDRAGRELRNEASNIDVDVDIRRGAESNSTRNSN